jgi:hypothetical protein
LKVGRIQRGSVRTHLQDKMMMLHKTFREALKEDELQEAFDELWPTWANEMAAARAGYEMSFRNVYNQIFFVLGFLCCALVFFLIKTLF